MLKTIANRYAKRAAARRRTIRHRAAIWKQRARRALTLMAVAGGMMGAGVAHAQMGGVGGMGAAGGFGQGAMAPTGGLVNRAVTRLQNLEANGPGWLYYGLNAADRGLGYNGSYMTLGGFIPYAEDDLGGLWSADLRSHLSEYGGFFSNVGAVRKQFIGGTILGVGVYWDYDGDQNQYPLRGNYCGTGVLGQFGHSYNQVGVSAEWLTDYGNLRSNGYIPVGTTAYTAGAPGSPFFQNFVMCEYGYDAALSGADLEVGVYVPGLSDWAGMISVGGYALGNERYNWDLGPKRGQDVVPFFGGVYTRLDLTLLKNWDFSLQANNDSFFDWTGFARLTYRMGGSRRRNVPDQMEQPMMRNEHIVRAHKTPEVAFNPVTGTPWRVIHVNNAFAGTGNGSATAPFTTVEAGNAAATTPYDIVLVDRGNATYNQTTPFSPLAANQYFIGNGTPFYLPNVCCDPINIATTSGPRPTLTNPTGASVNLTNGLAVNNFNITGSQIGILGTGNLSSGLPRPGLPVPFAPPSYGSATGDAFVNNVTISGTKVANQTGVFLDKTTGTADFQNTIVQDMTNGGFVVDGGDPNVNFSGQIVSGTATNGGFVSPIVQIVNTTGGTINLANGTAPPGSTVANKITDTGGAGIIIADNAGGTINIGNATLTDTVPTAIDVENSFATINITDSNIAKTTAGTAINVNGGAPVFDYKGKISNELGNLLHVAGTTGGSVTLTSPTGSPFTDNGDGILVENAAGDVSVFGATINSQQEGILVQNSSGVNTFNDITITGAVNAGVSLQGNTGTDQFNNLNIQTTGATGVLADGANIVNVTGNSTVSTTGAPAVSMTDVAKADVNFKSVSSTNSTSNGVLLDNVSGAFKSTTVTVDESAASGFVVKNSTGIDLKVGSATISTKANPGANGIEVTNSTSAAGAIEFTKIDVTTSKGTGVLVSKSDLVKIGSGTVDATGGASIDATNSKLAINLTSMTSTASTTNGVNLVANEGSVVSGQTTVTSPAGTGINVVNSKPGFIADFGVTTVTNSGGIGVNITNPDPPPVATNYTSFDSLAITTTNATGFQAINGGTVNFNSPAEVTVTGGAAVIIDNTVGTLNDGPGSGFHFTNLSSTSPVGSGVIFRDMVSDVTVTGKVFVDGAGAGGPAVLIENTAWPTPTDSGIVYAFNEIEITRRNSVGMQVQGIAGTVVVESLVVDNLASGGGPGLLVRNTTIPGATPDGAVYIRGGTISDSNTDGVQIQNAVVSLQNMAINDSASSAILVTSQTDEITTFLVNNSVLTGSGNDGVRILATGAGGTLGTVNATVTNNTIDAINNPLSAYVNNADGRILLDARNNHGVAGGPPTLGSFLLQNNGGNGDLAISQSPAPPLTAIDILQIDNFGVTVSTPGAATIGTGAVVPVP